MGFSRGLMHPMSVFRAAKRIVVALLLLLCAGGVYAQSCSLSGGPTSFPSTGGSLSLSAVCTGLASITNYQVAFRLNGGIVVQTTASSDSFGNLSSGTVVSVAPNASPSPRTDNWTTNVCAVSGGCSSFIYVGTSPNFPVTVAGAPVAPPANCVLIATPSTLPAGGGNSTLSVSCDGGSPPTSYAWSGPGVNPSAGASQVVNVTATSTYTVVAINAGGSSAPAQTTVTVLAPPAPVCSVSGNPANPVNPGTSVGISASCTNSPTSYAWTANGQPTGITTPSFTANPQVTTNYTVTATNAGGSTQSSYQVVVNALPPACTISANPGNPVAPGTPVTMSADCTNSPTSYSWTANGVVVGQSQVINQQPQQTTTYNVTATNAGGSAQAQYTILVGQALACTPTQTPPGPVSPGTPITLQSNCTGNPTSFSWTVGTTVVGTGPTLPVNAPTTTTTYTIVASGARGSSAPANIVVQIAPPPACVPTQNPPGPVAAGTPITLLGNCTNSPTSFRWTLGGQVVGTGPTLPLNAPAQTSTYQIVATNAAGTSQPANITVQVTPTAVPVCTATQNPPGAVNAGTPITLIATCTNSPTSYSWTLGGSVIGTGATLALNAPAQATTYTLVATNAGGSSTPVPVTVQVNATAANIVNVSGNPPPANPGATVPLVLKVVDSQDRPVSNAQFAPPQVTGGSGTVTQVTQNPSDGIYRFDFTFGSGNETRQVRICLANDASKCATYLASTTTSAVVEPAKAVIGPLATTAVTTPTIQLDNIRQRLDQRRLVQSPSATQGLRVNWDGQSLPPLTAFAPAPGNDGKAPTGGGAAADDPFARWSGYITGDVAIGRQSDVPSAGGAQNGFKLTSKGITAGADYRFDNNSVLGAALGYMRADTDLNNSAGTQDADGYSFSVYGSYVPVQNAYIDLIFNFGHNNYDSQRKQATTTENATSSTGGDQWGVALSAGYSFSRGPATAVPYVRVEYVDAKVDGFTESGLPGEALTISEQRIKATTWTLGGQASYAFSTNFGVLMPYGRLEFQRVSNTSVQQVYAGLAGFVPVTLVPSLGQDKSFGNFALGLTGIFPNNLSAFFNYQQLFGQDNYRQQQYTLGIRYNF